MSDVLSNNDLDALAAEYVLGTLDAEERQGATGLLEVDHVFRGTVRIWERRLGELHLMVEPVEPDPKVWERIRSKLDGVVVKTPAAEAVDVHSERDSALAPPDIAPAGTGLADIAPPGTALPDTAAADTVPADVAAEAKPPETAAPDEAAEAAAPIVEVEWPETRPAPDEPRPRPADTVPRGVTPSPMMRRRETPAEVMPPPAATGRGWKITTALTALIALVLVALIGAWRFFPERLPPPLRATTVLKLPEPPPPPPRKPPPPPFDE